MPAWFSHNMHKPVAASEELVPHLQGFSSAITIIFVVVKESRLYTDKITDGGFAPRVHCS